MLEKCWTCGKRETYEGEHFVGQSPYALAMCITEEDRIEVTDEEVFCDDCYENSVGDI
jgi:hypothetical protein